MILPIVLYGNEMLRTQAQPIVNVLDAQIQRLIADMFETMYNAAGVGLAAPQIGKSVSLFVVDGTAISHRLSPKRVFINPRITWVGEEVWDYSEGCLSLPFLTKMVSRPKEIEVEFQDATGETQKQRFSGIEGRIILHEYDHLLGKLFVDYLSVKEKQVLKNKLKHISNGKIKTPYPTTLFL